MRREEAIGNAAYNRGLWSAVKWNPLKWWGYLLYSRPTTDDEGITHE